MKASAVWATTQIMVTESMWAFGKAGGDLQHVLTWRKKKGRVGWGKKRKLGDIPRNHDTLNATRSDQQSTATETLLRQDPWRNNCVGGDLAPTAKRQALIMSEGCGGISGNHGSPTRPAWYGRHLMVNATMVSRSSACTKLRLGRC